MSESDVPLTPDIAKQRLQELGATVMFEKMLTTSDTSGSGRIVIPKSIAEANFPEIDNQNGVVVHLLDVFGRKYGIRYRFWINNASRMYLIEGTQELLTRFNMAVGDVLVFARTPSSQQIYVCGRKGTKEDLTRKAPGKRKGSQQPGARPPKRPPIAAGNSGADSGELGSPGVNSEPQRVEELRGKGGAPAPVPPPPRSKRTKNRAQDAAAAAAAGPNESNAATATLTYSYWNASSLPARRDGVFRAVPASAGLEGVGNVVKPQHGLWTAVVTLGGEAFQAFFDSREAAVAACEAAQQTAGG